MTPFTVLLVEDHALVREGLRSVIGKIAGVELVGEASNGRNAVEAAWELEPDLVLMDISMPEMNGLEATRRLRDDHPRIRVLILSAHANEEYVYQALRAGASGYLLKDDDRSEFTRALRLVERGETYLSPSLGETTVTKLLERAGAGSAATPLDLLTPRQREVLQLVAEGNTTREIAGKLAVSPKTVETHRRDIRERLEIEDLAGLVKFAIRTGLVTPEE